MSLESYDFAGNRHRILRCGQLSWVWQTKKERDGMPSEIELSVHRGMSALSVRVLHAYDSRSTAAVSEVRFERTRVRQPGAYLDILRGGEGA